MTHRDRSDTERQKQTLHNYHIADVSFSSSSANSGSGSAVKRSGSAGQSITPTVSPRKSVSSSNKSASRPSSAAEVIEALESQKTELQNTIIDMQTQINDLSRSLKEYENEGVGKSASHQMESAKAAAPTQTETSQSALDMLDKINAQKDRIEQLEHRNTHLKQV